MKHIFSDYLYCQRFCLSPVFKNEETPCNGTKLFYGVKGPTVEL